MMNSNLIGEIAGRLMRCPAAPYHEGAVIAEVERICAEKGLPLEHDSFGNLLARHTTAPQLRPLVLAAHLDHPGFALVRVLGPRRWLARFLGTVPDEFFQEGTKLRVMPGALPAVLGKRVGEKKEFEIHFAAAPPKGAVEQRPTHAVWELADFTEANGKIRGRACDDLIGVTVVLATLLELKRTRARVNVAGVLSRAEEVGFQGALAAASAGQLPKNALVISLETSRELPPAKMGRGVILRVGDRASVFDAAAMRFLAEVAGDIVKKDKTFTFQRALMSGGTCEGTAYQELGFQTGAVCVALGNYHNCGARSKIAAEYVSLADAQGMARLLTEAARRMADYDKLTGRLPARLRRLLREGQKVLRATS